MFVCCSRNSKHFMFKTEIETWTQKVSHFRFYVVLCDSPSSSKHLLATLFVGTFAENKLNSSKNFIVLWNAPIITVPPFYVTTLQEAAGISEAGNKKLSCVIILSIFLAHWSTLTSSVPFAFTFADVTRTTALIGAHTEVTFSSWKNSVRVCLI